MDRGAGKQAIPNTVHHPRIGSNLQGNQAYWFGLDLANLKLGLLLSSEFELDETQHQCLCWVIACFGIYLAKVAKIDWFPTLYWSATNSFNPDSKNPD